MRLNLYQIYASAALLVLLTTSGCGSHLPGVAGTVDETGAKGWLVSSHPNVEVFVATDEKAFDDVTNAAIANDTYGVKELLSKGKIFIGSYNSRVLVIDSAMLKTKVRLLDGDNIGKAGWVPFEFVKDSPGPTN
jgi:hypothetical protein